MDGATDINDSRRVRLFRGVAERHARRLTRRIIIFAILVTLARWSFGGWSLWSEYDRARETAIIQDRNLVAALAGDLCRTLDSVNRSFRALQHEVNAASQPLEWADLLPRLEKEGRSVAEQDRELRVADAEGRVLLLTGQLESDAVSVADENHFRLHQSNPAPALLIEQAGPDGRSHVAFSRRLQTADGHFAGEATILLPPAALLNLYNEINLSPHGRIVVADARGVVLAGFDRAHPDGTAGAGTVLPAGALPTDLQPGETSISVRPSAMDGVERLVAVRRLRGYDLSILLAFDMKDVVASARSRVWVALVAGLAATLLIAILSWLLAREVWRRTGKEVELAVDRERLRQSRRQLDVERARLAATNRELVASKDRAEAASRIKTQFLAHMSHELRTPLHAILGFAELIRDQAPRRANDPPIPSYAGDILTSGRHLLELINRILDITKIESGTVTLSESLVQMDDILRNASVTVRSQADARGISLDVICPEAPVRLLADRTRLLQIVINLLSNAVKFTPDGGHVIVSVTVELSGEVVLAVIDNGVGMTDAELAIALEPFGQVQNSVAGSPQGTGLGLPLASRLAEMHGGRLEVSSVKGSGTAVRVILPASRVVRHADAVPVVRHADAVPIAGDAGAVS